MRQRPTHLKAERGVALITALLVTAIVTVVAVGMASRQQLDIRRTGNIFDYDQAYHYALGVESWAQGVLATDLLQDTVENDKRDFLTEPWATVLPPIEVEGGEVAGRIIDLQGRFNLNNLVPPLPPQQQNQNLSQPQPPNPEAVAIFQRLLRNLGLNPDLIYPVIDWIDEDVVLTINGAEAVQYLKNTPAYRTADGPMSSPSELLMIEGFTPEAYALLAPYVTALPQPTPINVNTAPGHVLAALGEGISVPTTGEETTQLGPEMGFRSLEEFKSTVGAGATATNLTLASNYFMVHARGEAGRGQVDVYSILHRTEAQPGQSQQQQPGQVAVNVIMRGQGAY